MWLAAEGVLIAEMMEPAAEGVWLVAKVAEVRLAAEVAEGAWLAARVAEGVSLAAKVVERVWLAAEGVWLIAEVAEAAEGV